MDEGDPGGFRHEPNSPTVNDGSVPLRAGKPPDFFRQLGDTWPLTPNELWQRKTSPLQQHAPTEAVLQSTSRGLLPNLTPPPTSWQPEPARQSPEQPKQRVPGDAETARESLLKTPELSNNHITLRETVNFFLRT